MTGPTGPRLRPLQLGYSGMVFFFCASAQQTTRWRTTICVFVDNETSQPIILVTALGAMAARHKWEQLDEARHSHHHRA